MIRQMWRAASSPGAWFGGLEAAHPDLKPALLAALLSLLAGALGLGLAFLRATASAALGLGLLLAFPLLGAGSLLLQTLGRLDLRAWEVVAWSWTPAFWTSVSFLPAAFLAPTVALPLGLLTAVVWHLVVLRAGLRVFMQRRRGCFWGFTRSQYSGYRGRSRFLSARCFRAWGREGARNALIDKRVGELCLTAKRRTTLFYQHTVGASGWLLESSPRRPARVRVGYDGYRRGGEAYRGRRLRAGYPGVKER